MIETLENTQHPGAALQGPAPEFLLGGLWPFLGMMSARVSPLKGAEGCAGPGEDQPCNAQPCPTEGPRAERACCCLQWPPLRTGSIICGAHSENVGQWFEKYHECHDGGGRARTHSPPPGVPKPAFALSP